MVPHVRTCADGSLCVSVTGTGYSVCVYLYLRPWDKGDMTIRLLLQIEISHFLFKGKLTDDICEYGCTRVKLFCNKNEDKVALVTFDCACFSIFKTLYTSGPTAVPG